MTDTLTFAPFAPAHLEGALRLSQEAGWPHRMEDWRLVQRISRGVVVLDGPKVVGTALATPFGTVAMANMIIVDAAMRGRGLGRRLMDRMMAGVDVPEWRLVATEDGLPLYEKLGFAATGQILQHQGVIGACAMPEGVVAAEPADLPAILALDRQATGADRTGLLALLNCSLASPESFAEVQTLLSGTVAKLVLFVALAGLAYHFLAGIKHLVMDWGVGETLEGGRAFAKAMLVTAAFAIAAIFVWVVL